MHKSILYIIFSLVANFATAQTNYTWTGNTSSDWNNVDNWNPNAVPLATDNLIFNNAAPTNFPVLDADRAANQINFTEGSLDLNGFTLTISGNTSQNISGGSINNGNLIITNATTATLHGGTHSANFTITADSPTFRNSIFSGIITAIRTGNANIDSGGNTFDGNVTFTNNGTGNTWRFSSTSGPDTFNGTLTINQNSSNLDLSRTYASPGTTYNQNININQTGGNLTFGAIGGETLLGDDVQVITNTLSSGTLSLRNLTQNNATNITLTASATAVIDFQNSTFNGNITVNTLEGNFTMSDNTFNGTLDFTGGGFTISNNIFKGITNLTKNFTSNNTSLGGNTFDAATSIKNMVDNSIVTNAGDLTLANSNPDIFNSDVLFESGPLSIRNFNIAHNSVGNQFNGNVTLNSDNQINNAGGIRFGNGGSTGTVLFSATTDILIGVNDFVGGTLTLRNCTFNKAQNLTFASTIDDPNNTGIIEFINCTVNENFTFDGPLFRTTGSTFEKDLTISLNGISEARSAGNNIFNGALSITQNSNLAITFARDNPDTYEGTLSINKKGTGNIIIGFNSIGNAINGNISLTCNNTGSILFGNATSTTVLGNGVQIQIPTEFSNGNLQLNNITQNDASNLSINLTGAANITLLGNTFLGNITLTGEPTSGNFSVNQNNTFNGDLSINAGGFTIRESTFSGSTQLTKTGSNSSDSFGGNTFDGSVVINQEGTGRLRFGNNLGGDDTFNSTVLLNSTNTGVIDLARVSVSNFFESNVTVQSDGGGNITFGTGGGGLTLSAGVGILIGSTYNSGTLDLRNIVQTDAVDFTINQTGTGGFTLLNTTLLGNLEVNNVDGLINVSGCTVTGSAQLTQSGNGTCTIGSVGNGNTFTGTFEYTGRGFVVNDNQFNNTATLTKNGSGNSTSSGGNTFSNATTINCSEGILYFASGAIDNPDVFQNILNLNISNTGGIRLARSAANSLFQGNIFINSTSSGIIYFGELGGTSIFDTGVQLSINTAFSSGLLNIRNITQNNAVDINLNFTGSGSFEMRNSTILGNIVINNVDGSISLFANNIFDGSATFTQTGLGSATIGGAVGGNTFNGPFSYVGRGFTIRDNIFEDTASFNKNGTGDNNSAGNNIFNGATSITHSGTNTLRFASTGGMPDTFNSTLSLNSSNNGIIELSHTAAGNVYNGNISIENANAGGIRFGFSNGTSTLNAASDFIVGAGGFSGTGDFRLKNFVRLNPNPLSLVFTGSSTQRIEEGTIINNDFELTAPSVFVTGGTINGNLTINKTGASANTSTGTETFTCTGNLIINNTGGTLIIGNNSNLLVGGNIDLSGSNATSINILSQGTGYLVLNGTAVQNITAYGTDRCRGNIRISNPNGINLSGGNWIITQNLDFDNGIFTSTSVSSSTNELLVFNDGATLNNVSNRSHVVGYVRKIGNQAFDFPVGNGLYYRPISISAPSNNTHHFTAAYFNTDGTVPFGDDFDMDNIHNFSQQEHWILDRTAGTSNVSVTLSWDINTASGINETADLIVVRFNGTQWVSEGGSAITGNTSFGSVTSGGAISSFSPFTIGSSTIENALPIQLLSFTVEPLANSVQINWSTASEINNSHFIVEKSTDLKNWSFIDRIEGAGFSREIIQYNTKDYFPYSGQSFYRLTQYDFDGRFEIFEPISVNYNLYNKIEIFPNPFTEYITIVNVEPNSIIEVFDLKGNKLLEQSVNEFYTQLNLTSLNKGLYFIRITNNNKAENFKVIKQ